MLRAGLRGKRLSLSDDDRRRLAVKAQALGREALAQIASVATPATLLRWLCLLFIHPLAHGSEVSPAARNTLDSARIPRASMLMICGLFLKGRVLAQDGDGFELGEPYIVFL